MKKFLVLIFAVAFVLGVVGFSLAAMNAYHGTITAISGNKVSVKDAAGKIENITVSGTPGAKDWKVGDKVVVNDGKIISEDDWEHGPTTHGPTTHGPTTTPAPR